MPPLHLSSNRRRSELIGKRKNDECASRDDIQTVVNKRLIIINDRDNKTQSIVTSENRIPIASAVGAVSFVLFCATARFNFVRRFSTSRSPNASLSPPPLSPPPPPPLATQFRKRRLRRLRRRCRVPSSSPRRQRNAENVFKVVIEGEGQRNIVLFCNEKCGTISPLSTTHSAH